MINETTISEFPVALQLEIRSSLKLLSTIGLWTRQRQILLDAIMEGDEDEEPIELANRILEFRKNSHRLLDLHHLGESFKTEDEE